MQVRIKDFILCPAILPLKPWMLIPWKVVFFTFSQQIHNAYILTKYDTCKVNDGTNDPGITCDWVSPLNSPFEWQLCQIISYLLTVFRHTIDSYCHLTHASISLWQLSALLFGTECLDVDLCDATVVVTTHPPLLYIEIEQSGRSPKVVALFLLQTLVAI